MLNDTENGAKNWEGKVKDLLNSHGFTYIWEKQHVLDQKYLYLFLKST